MDSPIVRYREEDGNQRQLPLALAEVRRRCEMPAVVSPDFLRLSYDSGDLYYMSSHLY